MIKKINYFFQAIIIYFLFLVGRIIGLNLSRKFFSFIFNLLGSKFRSNKILEENLKIFSKEISNKEINIIKEKMWKNYGKTFIEYIFLDFFNKNNSHVEISGEEKLKNKLKAEKSVIFISGHFANFELMSMEITKMQIKLATIYRPLNNFFLNPLMEFLRKKYVCKNQIEKGIKGVRDTIEYIKKKHCIALMIDQRVSEGEKINLFGKPAFTTTLPAQLAIKFNLSIIPVYIERKEDNNFKIEFLDEIKPEGLNKYKLTNELNHILEKMIKRNPNQWIWTHNRWK